MPVSDPDPNDHHTGMDHWPVAPVAVLGDQWLLSHGSFHPRCPPPHTPERMKSGRAGRERGTNRRPGSLQAGSPVMARSQLSAGSGLGVEGLMARSGLCGGICSRGAHS